MKKLRFSIFTIFILLVLGLCYWYRQPIVTFVMKNVAQNTKVSSPEKNEYSINYNFKLVTVTNKFHVQNKQDILNVIYTTLNSGQEEFTFFCDINYTKCENDLKSVSEDSTLLSVINNMVHPYNSYEKLFITINSYGKSTLKTEKLYSKDEIDALENKVAEVEKEAIKNNMSNREKIKAFHDYLINHTVYDEQRAKLIEQGDSETHEHNSHKATGPLLEGWALCSGYSDAMKIFLDKLNLPNYKIANDNHIWNLVYLDGKWMHIDLTWDDPVTSDHSNVLLDKFFLVDTPTLQTLDTTNHYFNTNYYSEAN
ncbi:MAG: hypothetical protein IJ093_03370 [Bacilli bacterium]|nr:hypothetical protein [Bacilli bacterium]